LGNVWDIDCSGPVIDAMGVDVSDIIETWRGNLTCDECSKVAKTCDHCKEPLGARYYQKTPIAIARDSSGNFLRRVEGDFCLDCHKEWLEERQCQ
jgi:hypothetical protein